LLFHLVNSCLLKHNLAYDMPRIGCQQFIQ